MSTSDRLVEAAEHLFASDQNAFGIRMCGWAAQVKDLEEKVAELTKERDWLRDGEGHRRGQIEGEVLRKLAHVARSQHHRCIYAEQLDDPETIERHYEKAKGERP